jgi:pyrimidine deaminase RibD-like protein
MNRYLKMAVDIAARSKCRHRHGCVVVKNGKVISTSTNKKIGDPSVAWRISHIHAEFAAVVAAGTYACGSNVYVARVSADGSPAPSKPCKKCESIMERSGVAKVVWT